MKKFEFFGATRATRQRHSKRVHSRPQTLRFLDRARRLWGTLRKRSQNLAIPVPQRMRSAKPKWRLTWMQLSRLP